MKANDFISVLEYLKAFNKAEKPKRTRKTKHNDFEGLDIIALIQERRREAQALETVFKEIEKINKKEDKKEDPKGLSTNQLAFIFVATSIIAPLYVSWVHAMLGH